MDSKLLLVLKLALGCCLWMLTYEAITLFEMWCGSWDYLAGLLFFFFFKCNWSPSWRISKEGKRPTCFQAHYFLICHVAYVYCCPSLKVCELLSKWRLFNQITHLLSTVRWRQSRFRNNEHTFVQWQPLARIGLLTTVQFPHEWRRDCTVIIIGNH